MTKQEASECIEEIMNENLPEGWKHEFGLGSAKTQKLAAVLVLHRQVQVLQSRRTSVCTENYGVHKVAETRGLATGWEDVSKS